MGRIAIRPTAMVVVAIVASMAAIATMPGSACAALYAVTDRGIAFESTNDGVTWTEKGEIVEPEVVSLSSGLTSGQLYALGRTGVVYRSTNGATDWSAVGNVGSSDCVALEITRGGALVSLTQSGDFARSLDNGATWTTIANLGASDYAALAVGGKAGVNDTLYAATASGDIARSATGAVWTNVGTTGYTPVVDLIWVSKILYALTDAGEILRSSNSGVSWSAIGTVSQVGMRGLTFAGGKFKAISAEGEVYESATGASWGPSWIGTTNQVFTAAFASGLPEFVTGVGDASGPAPSIALHAWPNPFRESVSFRIDGVAPSGGSARVYDAVGRLVRTLASQPSGVLDWDGRDASGSPLAPGHYFVSAASGHNSAASRVTLLK
ncbi:MAG: FlgD immunoglobulin-like domain containing protein [bacterium]